MKKLFILPILTIFLLNCNKTIPNDGGITGGDGNPFNPANYPKTITVKSPALFVKNGTLKGYLPYPLINAVLPEGAEEELEYYTNSKLDPSLTGDWFKEFHFNEKGLWLNPRFEYVSEENFLVKNKYVNIKHEAFDGMEANRFCIQYEVLKKEGERTKEVALAYKQISDTVFERIGWVIRSFIVDKPEETIVEGSEGKECSDIL